MTGRAGKGKGRHKRRGSPRQKEELSARDEEEANDRKTHFELKGIGTKPAEEDGTKKDSASDPQQNTSAEELIELLEPKCQCGSNQRSCCARRGASRRERERRSTPLKGNPSRRSPKLLRLQYWRKRNK